MAISQIQAASANTTNVAISATQVGDLILVFAYRNASVTAPTLATNFTSILTNVAGTLESCRVGFKISTGGETTSGTWANATNVVCIVYRGARTVGTSATTQGSGTSLSYPAITLANTSGSSWVVGMGGAKAATAGLNGTTTALVSNRTNQTTVNGLDTNGGVTSFIAQTLTDTTSGSWTTASVELLAAAPLDESPDWPLRIGVAIAIAGSLFAPNNRFGPRNLSQQASAPSTIDEDYWQNQNAPDPAVNQWPQQFSFQQDEIVGGAPPPMIVDEDYARIPPPQPAKIAITLPYQFDQGDFPSVSVSYKPDEDLWDNPAPQPVPPTNFQFNIVPDDEFPQPITTAGSTAGSFTAIFPGSSVQFVSFAQGDDLPLAPTFVPDEDFAADLTPVIATPVNQWPQQFSFDQPEQLFHADEDFAPILAPRISPLTLVPPPWSFDQPEQFFFPDEDFSSPIVPPALAPSPRLYWFDQDDPAGSLSGQPDEDYFINWSKPAQWTLAPFNPSDVEEIPAGNLFGQYDEDFWISGVRPAQWSMVPFTAPDDQILGTPTISVEDEVQPDLGPQAIAPTILPQQWAFEQQDYFQVLDEDYWPNLTAPAPWTLLPFAPGDRDDAPPIAARIAEEELWINSVPPIAGSLRPFVPFDGEEIPAGSLFGQADEDLWRNSVPPVPAALRPFTPWDSEEIPAGSFFGQDDEDLWINSVPPVVGTNVWPQQWTFDTEDPQLFGPDDDLWINPVRPVPGSLIGLPLWLADPQDPAGSFFGQFDEDLWNNPVNPVPATLLAFSPLDREEIPAGHLSGQPDEDLWHNSVPPVPGANFQPLPYAFDAGEIAYPALTAPPDEDFWHNQTPPQPGSNFVQLPLLPDPEEIPAATLRTMVDEDPWPIRIPQSSPANAVQFIPVDTQELPALSIDEDYWLRLPCVSAAANLSSIPFDLQELPSISFDEECWRVPVTPTTPQTWPQPWTFDQDDIVPIPFTPDEDLWSSAARCSAASNGPLYGVDLGEIVPIPFIPGEDFYAPGLMHAPPLPVHAFSDPEELPAGNFFGQPDEDLWINPVAPACWTLRILQPWIHEQNDPAGSLFGPEEDYWFHPVAPVVASLYQPLPYFFEDELIFHPFWTDEDFWNNPVAPQPGYLWQPLPYAFLYEDGSTPELFFTQWLASLYADITPKLVCLNAEQTEPTLVCIDSEVMPTIVCTDSDETYPSIVSIDAETTPTIVAIFGETPEGQ